MKYHTPLVAEGPKIFLSC